MSEHKKPYTAEQVRTILRRKGRDISLEKAKIILQAAQKIAKLTVEQYFNL